jgi:hypothetical protein
MGFTSESAAGARVLSYANTQAACEQWRAQSAKDLVTAEASLPASRRLALGGCKRISLSLGADYWVSRVPYSETGLGGATLADCETLRGAQQQRGFSASPCTQVGVRYLQ